MVQWVGFGTFIAKGLGSVPGQGTEIPQSTQLGQKKKKEFRTHFCSEFAAPSMLFISLWPPACPSTLVLCLIPLEPGLLSSMEIEPFLEP